MSGIRILPPDDFINDMISLFIPNPDLNHITELNLNLINQEHICSNFIDMYPELELYYYPSKLKLLQSDNGTFTFNACICILRQILKKRGYDVTTKGIKKTSHREKLLIIRPPTS